MKTAAEFLKNFIIGVVLFSIAYLVMTYDIIPVLLYYYKFYEHGVFDVLFNNIGHNILYTIGDFIFNNYVVIEFAIGILVGTGWLVKNAKGVVRKFLASLAVIIIDGVIIFDFTYMVWLSAVKQIY